MNDLKVRRITWIPTRPPGNRAAYAGSGMEAFMVLLPAFCAVSGASAGKWMLPGTEWCALVRCRVACEQAVLANQSCSKPSKTLRRPPAVRALFVAVSPCLDRTDADYSCEVDADGDL